ncbi:MAG: hypothetical protein Q7S92_07340 [Candidatus Diapherotrites archaeon]|nr:hypothetical protein [Candidatus Diapherotrites archaeon]
MNGLPQLSKFEEERTPIWKAIVLLFLVLGLANAPEVWMQFVLSIIINIIAFGTGIKTAIVTLILLPSLVIPVYGWLVLNGFIIYLIMAIVLDILNIRKSFNG